MNQIETIIYKWIKKKGKDIKLRDNLTSNNIIDSFDMMELVIFCEKKFNIQFKEKDLINENFKSIQKIALVISKYSKNK